MHDSKNYSKISKYKSGSLKSCNFNFGIKFQSRIASWEINILISEILQVRKIVAKKNSRQEMLPFFRENTVIVAYQIKKHETHIFIFLS